MDEFESSDTVDATIDVSAFIPAKIQSLHQEGNYLVGITDTGTHFQQRIPNDKMLNQIDGQYVLQDMKV